MMSFQQTVFDSRRGRDIVVALVAPVTLVRLAMALVLLPLIAMAQQSSSLEVETAPGVWQFCSGSTAPGTISTALTSPARPTVGGRVEFRVRKNSIPSQSENFEVHDIGFAPTSSGPFTARTQGQVQFASVPSPLPMFFPEGGQCTVEIPVSGTCLISQVEGVDQDGNATENGLDFGAVPVGQSSMGVLQFGFSEPFRDSGIVYSSVVDPFHLAPGFELSPNLNLGFWDVSFMPTAPGPFEQNVNFVALRDSDDEACSVDVLLKGTGEVAGLTLTYGEFVCGEILEVPVTLSNPSNVLLENLDARVTSGFNLAPDPPGSFSGRNFDLGPAGSSEVPSERNFILRFPLTGEIPADPEITVTQVSEVDLVLLREPIPEAACIEILEPSNLTLNFGDVVVDTSGPQRSILIVNRGNSAATVTALLGETGRAQGFGLGEGEQSASLMVPASSQQTLAVTFVPPSVGAKQSVVDFMTSVGVDLPSVNLTGNGVNEPQPSLTFEVNGMPVNPGATIRFPATQLGQSSSLPLIVTNEGSAAALGLGLSAANGEFDVSGSSPAELGPDQAANYTLTFQPLQAGTRSGQLTLSGENVDMVLFTLEGQGAMGTIDIDSVGLSASVMPAQTPLPTVGLAIQGGAATQTLEGDLLIEFVPNVAQTPDGFLAAYQAVRFMAGSGAAGRTMRVRFNEGEQQGLFPAEQEAGGDPQLARFQSGTVAGSIQFRLVNVQTLDGAAVQITDSAVGSVTIGRLPPAIRSMTTPQTSTGINVVAEAVSTTREITGVCLALQAAASTELLFTRPDPGFLNNVFTQWFLENTTSFAPGGAFLVTIPIDISNMQTFGSAQIWLRNSEGWSGPNSPCP